MKLGADNNTERVIELVHRRAADRVNLNDSRRDAPLIAFAIANTRRVAQASEADAVRRSNPNRAMPNV